jgi:sulfatase modifying factor 1
MGTRLFVGIAVCGLISFLSSGLHSQTRKPEQKNQPGTGGNPSATRLNPKDGAEMILIPAGRFLMGDEDMKFCANPRRTVTLPGFYIYKYPVTVKQYMQFCRVSGHAKPEVPASGWRDEDPIVNVRWEDARAYCAWAGVQLPTEAQWEKAARGTEGRKYPWGNDWDGSKCVNSVSPQSAKQTDAVSSHPEGKSPYGVMQMAGNVYEWCLDRYQEKHEWRVLRGGAWNDGGKDLFRTSYRFRLQGDDWNRTIGFRCAAGI